MSLDSTATAVDRTGEETTYGHASWSELLHHLCVAVRLEPDADRVTTATRVALDTEGSWSERATAACAHLGLRTSLFRGTVAQAVRAVGPEHPVLAAAPSREGWVMMTDRRGRSVQTVTQAEPRERWVRVGSIAAMVDPESMGPVEWVVVEPLGLLADTRPGAPKGDDPHHDHPSPLSLLRILMRQERHDLAVVLVYAVGVGLLMLATPIAVQALVGTVAFNTLVQPLVVVALLLLLGLSFAAVLRALQAWVVELLQQRIFVRMVSELSHRLPRVRRSAYDDEHGPELVNRFFDVFTIQKAASSLLLGGLEVMLTAVVGMLVLAFYHPLLLAFDVMLMLALATIFVVLGRGATKTAIRESYAKYAMASWLEEVATHKLAFGLSGGTRLARTRADQLAVEYLSARRAHFRVVYRQLIGALVVQALASGAVLGLGGWLVIERQLTLGQLVAAELIVTAVVASFTKLGKHLETSYDLLAAIDKVNHLVTLPQESSGPETRPPAGAARRARVTAHELEFTYPDGITAVSGVSLTLDAGERIAIAGGSGSGRSTLVELLAGVREPTGGRVEHDGVDAQDLHRDLLRKQVAIVRRGEWVSGTIAENVSFGRPEIDPTDVREALAAVGLLDEVAALPEGLRTVLRRNGAPLSQGQAIRLSIARAIAGAPAFLVIDGALDALDRDTRRVVAEALFRQGAPWTLAVVTADPEVRERCDRSYVLVDGSIQEES